jgi:methylated-DNA-[protein]-cysteine S-methyltransferase|tara:strand:+ start:2675 stop:3121 length:447 start_codon:yes stop_codon:yes gene_type:complete
MIKQISIKTRFGWISAFEEKGRIVKIKFGKTRKKSISSNLRKFKNSLNNFITGKSKSIKSNLLIKGNPIQKKVWEELKNIKFGKTKTYGEIAKKFKLSPRHVGKICGQNKMVLVIPCHRVIRSDGNMGGFSSMGGVSLKKKLLDFEKG